MTARLVDLGAWARAHPRPTALVAGVAVAVLGSGVALIGAGSVRDPQVVVGRPSDPAVTAPAAVTTRPPAAAAPAPVDPAVEIEDGPGLGGAARRRQPSGVGLLDPDGRPYGRAVPFNSSIPVPRDLRWILIIGTDARPGEDPLRTRADSIHLVAVNPGTREGTIVGLPRDSWVDIPGHGTGKINTATVLGGPDLLARTIHRFTGLPVQHWVVTGFRGFADVVDAVGGVDVLVEREMDDRFSEAHFQPGYHHFDGAQALAYARNRHDHPDGDFGRSRTQGRLALAALAKLRAEVRDEAGLRRWMSFAFRHLDVQDISPDEALSLLALARSLDPADVRNLVAEGRGGTAGSQSVVYLDARKLAALADDLRPDAVVGAPRSTTTTTTAPDDGVPDIDTSTTSTTGGSGTTTTTRSRTTVVPPDPPEG